MKRTIRLMTAIIAFGLLFTACESEENEIKENESEENNPITIIGDIHITEDISENTTWEAQYVYYVDQSINIKNDAILTIEPGTMMKFAPGVILNVANYSTELGNIIAVGAKDKPIIFTSQAQLPSSGDWDGIWLWSGASASKFEHCIFRYAGNGVDGAISTNDDARVSIDFCNFESIDGYGVCDRNNNQGVFVSFTYNTFIDNSIKDIKLKGFNVSSIGEGNEFSKDIEVLASDVDAPGDVFWRKLNTDYLITGDIIVGCNTSTTLIIEAGTTLKFSPSKTIDVAYASTHNGSIVAEGTAEDPITFTSAAANPSSGDWDGIRLFSGSTSSKFKHCIIRYAGNGRDGAISTYEDVRVSIDNCTFESTDGYGVCENNQNQGVFVSFTNNIFIDNSINDLTLRAFNVSSIGKGNAFEKDIKVMGSAVDAPGDVVWANQNTDYLITGDITVGCNTSTTLIIDAGTTLKFSPLKSIEIAYASTCNGMIKAEGTDKDPITFTSAAANPSKGDWGHIIFYDGSATGSIFDYCDFSYGGQGANAMIVFKYEQGATTTISNCSFSYSEGYGIMKDHADSSNPILMKNMFTDNTLGDKNW